MNSRTLKQQVRQLLLQEDLSAILEQLARIDAQGAVNALFSFICRSEELLRWHAVSCMGPTVARLAARDMETARIIMRRFLWSLNDESGGIGWGAPEAMAEVMANEETLAREYMHMLVSYMREDGEELFQDGNYLEHELLQRGLLWGIHRLALKRRELLLSFGVESDVAAYLDSPEPVVRALAAGVMNSLGFVIAEETRARLAADKSPVRIYHEGLFFDSTVSEFAKKRSGDDRAESMDTL